MDIDVRIRLTPPYGKSVIAAQMRHAIAAMRGPSSRRERAAACIDWIAAKSMAPAMVRRRQE
jgi:hypothetical protein